MPRNSAQVSVEATASTTEASSSFGCSEILYVTNDGSVDITFNIDQATTEEGAFTLKAGETLNFQFPRQSNMLYYKTASSTAAFRALGLRVR